MRYWYSGKISTTSLATLEAIYPRRDHVHMPFEIEREEVTLRSVGLRVESPSG
jgi:hypothetical protein